MEITQQERLDLTDKQVISEKEAYTKSMDIKEIMKQSIPDLLAENQRLKEQLDREIKINRKMKSVLKEYADKDNWEYYNLDSSDECLIGEYQNCEPNEVGFEPALQVLKEIDNKE